MDLFYGGSQEWKNLPRKPLHHQHHHHHQAPPTVAATQPLLPLYCLCYLYLDSYPLIYQHLHRAEPPNSFMWYDPSPYLGKIAYPRRRKSCRRKSLHWVSILTLSIDHHRATSRSSSPSGLSTGKTAINDRCYLLLPAPRALCSFRQVYFIPCRKRLGFCKEKRIFVA